MSSVKICRIKLIKALEAALKKELKAKEQAKKDLEKRKKQYEADLLQWHKDWEAWQTRYKNLVPNSRVEFLAPNNYHIAQNERCWEVRIRYVQEFGDIKMNAELTRSILEKNLPQKPEKPTCWDSHGSRIQEIEKLLKLLKMSEEEVVSTGVYKNVVDFI